MTDGGARTYRLLDIPHIIAAKLAAFCARGTTDSSDFLDLIWLVTLSPYESKLREVSGSMPFKQKEAFLAAASGFKPKLSELRMRRIKHILRLA